MAKTLLVVNRVRCLFLKLNDEPLFWLRFVRFARSVVFAAKQVHDANLVATMLA